LAGSKVHTKSHAHVTYIDEVDYINALTVFYFMMRDGAKKKVLRCLSLAAWVASLA